MVRKLLLWSLWIGFILYILLLAPPIHKQETLTLLQKLLTFQWQEINPVVFSLFCSIGIWLLIYSCVLFFDGRMQSIPFYPFALAGIGSGVIGLLPYLAWREDNREFAGAKDSWLSLLDSRNTGIILMLSTLSLLVYGFGFGDWAQFWQQFQSDRFINGMSWAFCLLSLVFPTVLDDDMARRGFYDDRLFRAIASIPLLGPLVYLCVRPPLQPLVVQ